MRREEGQDSRNDRHYDTLNELDLVAELRDLSLDDDKIQKIMSDVEEKRDHRHVGTYNVDDESE
jgi:hypothetical protein